MPKIVIIYASISGKTKKMAEAIASGAKSVEGVDVLLKNVHQAKSDDVLDANAVILGGSTYNNKLVKTMDPFLVQLEKLDLNGKVGAAFGSHGWSGEGVPILIDRMKSFGISMIEPGTTAIQVPNKEDIEKCNELGKAVANGLIN